MQSLSFILRNSVATINKKSPGRYLSSPMSLVLQVALPAPKHTALSRRSSLRAGNRSVAHNSCATFPTPPSSGQRGDDVPAVPGITPRGKLLIVLACFPSGPGRGALPKAALRLSVLSRAFSSRRCGGAGGRSARRTPLMSLQTEIQSDGSARHRRRVRGSLSPHCLLRLHPGSTPREGAVTRGPTAVQRLAFLALKSAPFSTKLAINLSA